MKRVVLALLLFGCQQIKSEEPVRIGPSTPERTTKIVQAISAPVSSDLCAWQVKFSPNGSTKDF